MKLYKVTKIIPSAYGGVEAGTQWLTYEPSDLDSTYYVISGHFVSDKTYTLLVEKAFGTDLTLTNAQQANETALKIVNNIQSGDSSVPNEYIGQLNKAAIIGFIEACKYQQKQIDNLTAKVTLLEVRLHFKMESEEVTEDGHS